MPSWGWGIQAFLITMISTLFLLMKRWLFATVSLIGIILCFVSLGILIFIFAENNYSIYAHAVLIKTPLLHQSFGPASFSFFLYLFLADSLERGSWLHNPGNVSLFLSFPLSSLTPKQEEKGMTEDEMAGWHHQLDGHEFESILGVGDVQGGLACCGSWGCKESDTTEWVNWLNCVESQLLNIIFWNCYGNRDWPFSKNPLKFYYSDHF